MESFVTRLSWEEPRNAGTGPRADPGMRGQILGRILGWIPTRGDGSWNIWDASWNVWDASWDAFGDVSATGRLPSLNTEALPLALSLEVANNLEAPTIVAALVAFLAPP